MPPPSPPRGQRKRGRRSKDIPWDEIRDRYVTDPKVTQADLSREYDVRPQHISRRARTENWEVHRAEHQESVRAEVLAKLSEVKGQLLTEQALDLLSELKTCRKAIVEAFLKGLRGEETEQVDVVLAYRQVGNGPGDSGDRNVSHWIKDRKVTKRRIRADGRFAEMLIRTEAELIQVLAGIARDAAGGAVVEIKIGEG